MTTSSPFYLSDFNRNVITKILRANDIEFHELMDCMRTDIASAATNQNRHM